jgi:hypothetical protein
MASTRPADPGKAVCYQAPRLNVYGGMSQLTAAGSMGVPETWCFNDPGMSGGNMATAMNKSIRC